VRGPRWQWGLLGKARARVGLGVPDLSGEPNLLVDPLWEGLTVEALITQFEVVRTLLL
jgi:hypothetical protein